jgi:hydrogenase expression/formation protein HypC
MFEEMTMCLGIPGKVTNTYREHEVLMGKVDFGGVFKSVCLEHVPEVQVGEYVIVHVGFALSRIDEAEAKQVFEFLEGMNELAELRAGDSHEVPG